MFYRLNHLSKPLVSLTEAQQQALREFERKVFMNEYRLEEVECLCGSTDGTIIATRDRYALESTVTLCKRCGILWQTPRLDRKSLSEFYNHDYRPIYVGHETAPEHFFAAQIEQGKAILEFMAPYLGGNGANRKVFDIGCGAGGFLMSFAKAGWQTYGCDIGERYLELGRSYGLKLVHGDAKSLSRYGVAELILMSHVIEHLPDVESTLSEVSSLLKEDGLLYVELPGIFNARKAYGDFMLYLQNAHLYHFTLTTLSGLMERLGFRLIWGDETIRAIFQKGGSQATVETGDQYRKILRYIKGAEMSTLVHSHRFAKATVTLGSWAARFAFGLAPGLPGRIMKKLVRKT